MPDYPLYFVSSYGKLGCAQLDANTANLRQRSNHLGVQAASTIYDLKATMLAYPEIMELMSGDATLRSLIESLQLQVLGPTGHLAQVINNLRVELQSDIADEHARIDDIIRQVNSLQVQVAGHTTQITQHTAQINNLTTRVTANDADNQALWSAIGGTNGLTGRVLPVYTGPVRSSMFTLYMDNTRDGDVHIQPYPYTPPQYIYWGLPQMVDFGWVRYMNVGSGMIDFGTLSDRFAARDRPVPITDPPLN
ncbi:hypothetical protein [Microcoleus phage My-WqHQDG]|nr:hypothetical protein [Microcoleus phage My-WqHQDG]